MKIYVSAFTKSKCAASTIVADELYAAIFSYINRNDIVELSFKDIDTITSIFMFRAVGRLAGIYSEAYIWNHIKIVDDNEAADATNMASRVIKRAALLLITSDAFCHEPPVPTWRDVVCEESGACRFGGEDGCEDCKLEVAIYQELARVRARYDDCVEATIILKNLMTERNGRDNGRRAPTVEECQFAKRTLDKLKENV